MRAREGIEFSPFDLRSAHEPGAGRPNDRFGKRHRGFDGSPNGRRRFQAE
jgi:hypothetical protein